MLESLDRSVVAAYDRRLGGSGPLDAVLRHATEVGYGTILERITRAGERADRRLGTYLTGGAFVVALGGFSLTNTPPSGDLQTYLSGAAGILGAGTFLFALRGTTRRVGATLLTHEPNERDIRRGVANLRAKEAWGWASSRLLWWSVVALGVVSTMNAT